MKPILFNSEMVRAILNGRKTQTRRVVKLIDFGRSDTAGYEWHFRDKRLLWNDISNDRLLELAPYSPGNVLWVRETSILHGGGYIYRATDERPDQLPWKPSIFMPFDACRLFLKVESVHAERLQEITNQEAVAEGTVGPTQNARDRFIYLWNTINGKPRKNKPSISWSANPWVWVIKFSIAEIKT